MSRNYELLPHWPNFIWRLDHDG